MKKLILSAVVAAGLAFPLSSQAEVNAFGVTVPVEQREVSDNIKGGYVPKDLNDTFQVQKLNNNGGPTQETTDYGNVYTVFGVRLSGSSVI